MNQAPYDSLLASRVAQLREIELRLKRIEKALYGKRSLLIDLRRDVLAMLERAEREHADF